MSVGYWPGAEIKLGVWGPGAKGPGPHPPPGPEREAPSGSRTMRRRAACPPCRAAPTSTGCRPPPASRRRAGRSGRRLRDASRRRFTRAPSCPPAQRLGAGRRTVKSVDGISGARRRRRASGGPAAAAAGRRKFGQSPARRRRWRPRSWSGCRLAPTCCPPRQDLSSAPAGPAVAHLSILEELLHLMVGHGRAVGAKNRQWLAHNGPTSASPPRWAGRQR